MPECEARDITGSKSTLQQSTKQEQPQGCFLISYSGKVTF